MISYDQRQQQLPLGVETVVSPPRRVAPAAAGDTSRIAFEPHQTVHRDRLAMHAMQQPSRGGSNNSVTQGGGGGGASLYMDNNGVSDHPSAAALGFMATAPEDGFLHLPGMRIRTPY